MTTFSCVFEYFSVNVGLFFTYEWNKVLINIFGFTCYIHVNIFGSWLFSVVLILDTHAHVHTNTHICTHAHMHAHAHTHKHTHRVSFQLLFTTLLLYIMTHSTKNYSKLHKLPFKILKSFLKVKHTRCNFSGAIV